MFHVMHVSKCVCIHTLPVISVRNRRFSAYISVRANAVLVKFTVADNNLFLFPTADL